MKKLEDIKPVSIVSQKASEWIRKQYNPKDGGFHFSRQTPVCFIGSCCAALSSELLGSLSSWNSREIEAWAHYIQSFQQEDGWFEDPYLKPTEQMHLNFDYLRGHTTFLAVMALDALGQKPNRNLEFLDVWREDTRLYNWIDQRDWTSPWRESNWVEWIGYWLLADAELTVDDVPLRNEQFPPGIGGLMQWLEDHQDPATGFWGNPPCQGSKRTLNQMAAAYHHYVFYYATGKKIRYKDRIIDNVLALQQPDGLFMPGKVGGGTCEDLDAIDILANMYRLANYKRNDIEAALMRALVALLRNQRPDGAFVYAIDDYSLLLSFLRLLFKPWYRDGSKIRLKSLQKYTQNALYGVQQYYAGSTGLPFRMKGGDMFSQWFRPLAIAIAASVLGPNRSPVWWRFGLRRQITQGWLP